MHNDVWRSADGLVWEELTSDAPWAARSYHGVEAVGESLILFGGQGPVEFFNDVWRSDDGGRTWSKVLAHAPWAPRAGFKSMVVNDTILILTCYNMFIFTDFVPDVDFRYRYSGTVFYMLTSTLTVQLTLVICNIIYMIVSMIRLRRLRS